jgi:hypothetical protein
VERLKVKALSSSPTKTHTHTHTHTHKQKEGRTKYPIMLGLIAPVIPAFGRLRQEEQ